MSRMKLQPAVKKETKRVGIFTAAGVVVMWAAFAALHQAYPEAVPFDYRNFFLMGITVQKVASENMEDVARMRLKSSYTQRMLLQILWVIAAVAAPCFQFAAGIAPLLFPSLGIKLMAFFPEKEKE